jgi:glycosyltransferase involved in cell wall biosynthesis
MRLAVLGRGVSGYLEAGLRALSGHGVEMLIVTPSTQPDTDFSLEGVRGFATVEAWSTPPAAPELRDLIDRFSPEVVISGAFGALPAYRAVLRSRPPAVLRVMAMDNFWEGTRRQWAAHFLHRFYLDPYFDCALVPSDRSEYYAERLGFHPADIIRGSYTADVPRFVNGSRTGADLVAARRFLFAGRLVDHKGIDVLAEAYRQYRELVSDPWDLDIAGIGPLADLISAVPGVTMHGFVQPDGLATLMHRAACFVLPSRSEHYGVVVHEAAAAGLPLVVAHASGAVPGLLQDRVNGKVVGDDAPELWAATLAWLSSLPAERLQEMSDVSRALARRLSPATWGRTLYEEFDWRLAAGGGRYVRGRVAARNVTIRSEGEA